MARDDTSTNVISFPHSAFEKKSGVLGSSVTAQVAHASVIPLIPASKCFRTEHDAARNLNQSFEIVYRALEAADFNRDLAASIAIDLGVRAAEIEAIYGDLFPDNPMSADTRSPAEILHDAQQAVLRCAMAIGGGL